MIIRHKGFTIIEVIVAITISVIVITSVFAVYFLSQKSYTNAVLESELSQNGRIVMERISRELRQAEELISALPPDDSDPDNPPLAEIEFQDGHNPNPIQYIRYHLDGQDLRREVSHYYFPSLPDQWVKWNSVDGEGNSPTKSIDEDRIKAEHIENILFYGETLITVDLELSKDGKSYSVRTKIEGRNL